MSVAVGKDVIKTTSKFVPLSELNDKALLNKLEKRIGTTPEKTLPHGLTILGKQISVGRNSKKRRPSPV